MKDAFQPAIDAFNEFKDTLFGASEEDGFTPFVECVLEGVTSLTDFLTGAVSTVSDMIVEIMGFLTEAWEENGTQLMTLASSVWNGILGVISKVWDMISTVISGAIDIIKKIWENCGTEILTVVSAIWEYISGIVSGAAEVFSGVINVIVGIFTLNGDLIKEGCGKIWNGIKSIFRTGVDFVGEIFSLMWDTVKKVFKPVTSWFKSKFTAAWKAIKNVFLGAGDFFSGVWKKIKSKFSKIGKTVGNAVGGAFRSVMNSAIGFVQRMINQFIGGINGAISIINKIPGVSISHISSVSIPKMASGGLVEPGQLFIAREAGPELVGTMGNHTAVMNNSQIVEAVSAGVYKAVASAMGNRSTEPINITLQVGKTKFGKAVVDSINALSRVQGSVDLAI